MEFRLDVYKGKEIEKTYKSSEYDLMFGTMEDFINIIEPDKLFSGNNVDMGEAATKLLTGSINELKPIFMEVFPGLTEAELRRTRVKDLVKVGKDILKHSLNEMKAVATGKNA